MSGPAKMGPADRLEFVPIRIPLDNRTKLERPKLSGIGKDCVLSSLNAMCRAGDQGRIDPFPLAARLAGQLELERPPKTRSEVMWLPFFAQVSDECYLCDDALDFGSSSLTPW